MKRSILIIIISLLIKNVSFGQIVNIKGEVIDKNTGKKLIGVTVQVDKYLGTITNKKGIFNLEVPDTMIKKNGLSISYIGYKQIKVSYKSDNDYSIKMEINESLLSEVFISEQGKTIIEKAIKRIKINYSEKPTIINGIMRVYNIINKADYFYKSDGIVQIYYPPHIDSKASLSINLIQNKDTLIQNNQSKYLNKFMNIKWLGGFYSINDFVYDKPDFINLNKLKDYEYVKKGTAFFENREVYKIYFNSRKNNKIEGILYIDTSTYAFVGAEYTRYKIFEMSLIPISIKKFYIAYHKIKDKWYIKNTHTESSHEISEDNNYVQDFAFTSLDTVNVKPFSYYEIVQRKDENIKIHRTNNKEDWKKYDDIFKNEEIANRISFFPVPISTKTQLIKVNNNFSNLLHQILHYFQNNNIYYQIGILKLPININTTQPQFQNSISSLSNYLFNLELHFRLYNNCFLKYENGYNLSISTLTNKITGYYISNNFNINKKYHPITIAPYFGYNKITILNKKNIYYVKQGIVTGLNLSYEITHKCSYFLSLSYNYTLDITNHNNTLLINKTNFSPSTGIIIKF